MKFGKYLAKRQLDLPEYANFFINYKSLKRLIKTLAVTTPVAPRATSEEGTSYSLALQQHKATFFFHLERELEKVNSFYLQKEDELKVRLDILVEKKQDAHKKGLLTSKSCVTYITLHEGFQRLRRDLERLEQFIELNGTGFSKVLKKWDKRSKSQTKELYLQRQVEVQPIFHRDVLTRFSDVLTSSLLELEAWSDGDNVIFDGSDLAASMAVASVDHPLSVENARRDDLYYDFVNTATDYDNNEKGKEAIQEWIHHLSQTDDAKERITRIFMLAIPTDATEEALIQVYDSGFVDIHGVDEISGKNCLHRVAGADKSRDRILSLALENHVDVNKADVYGKTPLHYGCLHGRKELISPFLSHGANIDALDNDNFTPLMYAIVNGFSDGVQELVNAGAKLQVDSEKVYIPLNLACQYGNYDAVKILLEKNASLNFADAEGLFPIHIVAREGHHHLVPLLKSHGLDVNEVDKLNQWTALMYAASEGHVETVQALLEAGADVSLLDEEGHSALYFAAWDGRVQCMWFLSRIVAKTAQATSTTTANQIATEKIEESLDDMEISGDLEQIPDLSLPPPIIPLRRYGHNFLDKKILLQLILDPTKKPIKFHKEENSFPAGRLTISTRNNNYFIPKSIILPISDSDRVLTFQLDRLEDFEIDFEIYYTFGTRIMAKTTALPYLFLDQGTVFGTDHLHKLPLFDVRLKTVGEISFQVQTVKPFQGKPLEITKYDTYWKSTSQVEQQPRSGVQALSFVTASSLSGSYGRIHVCLTRDMVPVVAPSWSVSVKEVNILIGNITFNQLVALDDKNTESLQAVYQRLETVDRVEKLHQILQGRVVPLKEVLHYVPYHIKLDVCILYPTAAEVVGSNYELSSFGELNKYVDSILGVLFDHAREVRKASSQQIQADSTTSRSLVFSSANPEVCTALNWKQPNYPVFFEMDGIRFEDNRFRYVTAHGYSVDVAEDRKCVSLKEAVNFASTNNLLGIICNEWLLRLVPRLIESIRAGGLVLVAHGDANQIIEGVDGVRDEHGLVFKQDIDM